MNRQNGRPALMRSPIRFLRRAIVALVLATALPATSDVLLDAVQSGGTGYHCGRVVNGEFELISAHTQERKAIAKCMTEHFKDAADGVLDADYYAVRPTGEIRIVVSSEAAAQAVVVGPEEDPPSSPAPTTFSFASLGDECGNVIEDSATATTHNACGTNDLENFEYAYVVQSTDEVFGFQIKINSVSGVTENFTAGALGIRETSQATDADNFHSYIWNPHVSGGSINWKQRNLQADDGVVNCAIGVGTTGYTLRVQYDSVADEIDFLYSDDDGVNWQLCHTEAKTLTFPVRMSHWATSHSTIETVQYKFVNWSTDNVLVTPQTPAPDPGPREGLIMTSNFDGGVINGRFSFDKDAPFGLCQVVEDDGRNLTVTNITRANPGVVSYTGTDPTEVQGAGVGYTVSGVAGMTQINTANLGQGIRLENCNTGANTCEIWVDNSPPGNGNGAAAYDSLGVAGLDTRASAGFDAYTSGGVLQAYTGFCTGSADGQLGAGTGHEVRVVPSETYNGDAISPRAGSHFLRSMIDYVRPFDHYGSEYPSNWPSNNRKNKPRWGGNNTGAIGNSLYTRGVDYWIGFSWRLPNPLWSVDTAAPNDHRGRGFIWGMQQITQATDERVVLRFGKWPQDTSCNHWVLDLNEGAIEQSVGNACDDSDVGQWTDFVIHMRADDAPNGFFHMWKSVGAPDGNGNRQMELVYSDASGAYGPLGSSITMGPKVYYYAWHHRNSNSLGERWFGYDEMYVGEEQLGAGFEDVHATQQLCADIATVPASCQ